MLLTALIDVALGDGTRRLLAASVWSDRNDTYDDWYMVQTQVIAK
jgi:hypothetical protein